MNLDRAHSIARKIVDQLVPLCERLEIAGSIRRRRPDVNDIDLVLLPKPGRLVDIKARCRRSCRVVTDGPQNCIFAMKIFEGEFQLDLFIARPITMDLLQTIPGNFGSLLLCRTGSKEHNIYLIEHARKLGLVWKPYSGIFDGERCLAGETEEGIFAALQLEFIPPEKRER